MPGIYSVALADRRDLPLQEWRSLLSAREQMEAETYQHPVRRARTIASRLLTKYLVTHSNASGFHCLGADEIEAANSSKWVSVELLSGTSKARVGATLLREGKAFTDLSASASHCAAYTATCISSRCIGLDLERIEPRRQEFYAHTFSQEERDWTGRMCNRGSATIEEAFTLLWSVKEAYLKASDRHGLTVWAFPRWTVSFAEGVEEILQPQLHGEFARVHGAIHSAGFSQLLEMTFTRFRDMVLAIVQYSKFGRPAANTQGNVNHDE